MVPSASLPHNISTVLTLFFKPHGDYISGQSSIICITPLVRVRARVYGHTTTAMHDTECISPIEYTPPDMAPTRQLYCTAIAVSGGGGTGK